MISSVEQAEKWLK